jgi:RND family efflux transporter MFP subunit
VIIVVVVAAVAAALWAYPRLGRPEPLLLSGTVEARDVQVGSLVGGRVSAVHVDEGQVVKKGDVLVTLEPDLLDLQIKEQRAQVAQQRAHLTASLAGPRTEETNRDRVDWQNAEIERKRLEALLKEGVIGQDQYDNQDALAREKKETYEESARGNRPEDIDAARGALAEAEAHLGYLERQRKETLVVSPADGIVQSFDLRPGDIVGANQAVLDMLETSQLWVRVYVPETKFGRVHPGDRAEITVDTFPGRVFTGRVVEIRENAEYTPRNIQTIDQRNDEVFGVKVQIDPTPDLRPGMSALVTFKR